MMMTIYMVSKKYKAFYMELCCTHVVQQSRNVAPTSLRAHKRQRYLNGAGFTHRAEKGVDLDCACSVREHHTHGAYSLRIRLSFRVISWSAMATSIFNTFP